MTRNPRGKRAIFGLVAVSTMILLSSCTSVAPGSSSNNEPSKAAAVSSAKNQNDAIKSTQETSSNNNKVENLAGAGSCTATDLIGPEHPVMYSVFTDSTNTPVTITYTAFDPTSTRVITENDIRGPYILRVGYSCTDGFTGKWKLTATVNTGGSVGCALYYGGKRIVAESSYDEAPGTTVTVDCSGHPGM